jgi:adenylate kinase
MIIAIIGASGSGKGHICDYLEYRYPNKFQQIDVTAIIRKYITKNDAVGRKLFAYRKAKKYIPDDFIYEIVKTEVINALDSGKIVVLNNYPRTVELAKKFEIVHRIDFVLFLKNTYETMKKRLDNRRICSVCGTVTNVLYDTKAKYGICRKCGGMLEARIDDEVEYVEKK